jgi:predicted Zn-dependent protease
MFFVRNGAFKITKESPKHVAALGFVLLAISACASTSSPPGQASKTWSEGGSETAPILVMAEPISLSDKPKAIGLVALEEELVRAVNTLGAQTPKAYFLAYQVHDSVQNEIVARNGAILVSNQSHQRKLDVDVRVGDPSFDSTHPSGSRSLGTTLGSSVPLPLEDDPAAIKVAVWRETGRQYQRAVERFVALETQRNVKVALNDKSGDFTREQPVVQLEQRKTIEVKRTDWEQHVRELSSRFVKEPHILNSTVKFSSSDELRWFVSSEGTVVQNSQPRIRVDVTASSRATDGQDLFLYESFFAGSIDELPPFDAMTKAVDRLITNLNALTVATPAEPYVGPVLLEGKAAAVFLHEIFGHRVEGHRQKDETEGQTFAKKIGEQIMPTFLSVFDDPRIKKIGAVYLNGHYRIDDEGVPAQRASLVENGIMKGFLLSRTPVGGFVQSNGHGRRETGFRSVSRQGNIVVQPSQAVTLEQLKKQLRAEAQRRNLAYGLQFSEISGGVTMTGRDGLQAFKVIPLLVYKVFVDGRPDELIRGADLVGTPLSSISKILAASDDYAVFNGTCRAESGLLPVSSVSPSLLLGELEVERRYKGQDKSPVLKPPVEGPSGEVQP